MKWLKVIGLAVLVGALLIPSVTYRTATAGGSTPIYMMGRSVMEGWFYHWGWGGDDGSPVMFHDYSLYHRSVDGPEGDGGNMVSSARSIIDALPSGDKAVFFKLCFVDFTGGSQAAANENYERNVGIIEDVYAIAHGQGINLIVGNALPQVASATDSYLVSSHRQYNSWLDSFADNHSDFYVFDMYGTLSDSSGNLKAAYANGDDSHPNSAGYDALDSAYADFLANDFTGGTPTPPTPSDDPGDKPGTGSQSDGNYKENANKIITAPSWGCQSHVRAFSPRGTALDSTNFFAYDKSFRGGSRLALADVDKDGQGEIVAGAGAGGGPQVRVFKRDGRLMGIQFFAFSKDFHGGIDVAGGDFDGDGKDEIGVCQLSGGQGWAKVYRYNSEKTVLFERNIFGSAQNGCTVAFGDVDKDNRAELIVGSGAGGDSRVFSYDYVAGSKSGHQRGLVWTAFPGSKTGVDVEAADFDRDGKAELAAAQLSGSPKVKVVRYNSAFTKLGEFYAYPSNYQIGANLSAADINNDKVPDLLVGPNRNSGLQIKTFTYAGKSLASFFAYPQSTRGGVTAVAGRW